jgi:N-methylhydantoinase B
VTIAAELEIGDDELRVDFTGTDEQVSGAVNAPIAVTASATYYAARCVIDPDIPPSAGAYRPIEIEAPAGTVVNAEPPAAVVGGNLEVSQRIVDVLFGAFAAAAPERVAAAGQGTMNNLTLGGTDPRDGSPFAFYETAGGGSGGRASGDGMDGVHVHMSNTRNTPVEVLETAYPLRVRRYALRPDSGGAGEFRGGLGLRRDIEARTDVTCSVLADRRRGAPYGIAGGAPGATGEDYLLSGGECERIDPKSTRELTAGGTVSLRTPGGGGYGEPASRDETLIARDLRLGKVSRERVRTVYGLDPDALGADGSDT